MKNHEIKWKSSLQILHSTELFPHRLCSFHTLIFIHGENPASEQLVHILGKFSNLYKNTQLLDHFNITVPISLLRENQIFISVNFFIDYALLNLYNQSTVLKNDIHFSCGIIFHIKQCFFIFRVCIFVLFYLILSFMSKTWFTSQHYVIQMGLPINSEKSYSHLPLPPPLSTPHTPVLKNDYEEDSVGDTYKL